MGYWVDIEVSNNNHAWLQIISGNIPYHEIYDVSFLSIIEWGLFVYLVWLHSCLFYYIYYIILLLDLYPWNLNIISPDHDFITLMGHQPACSLLRAGWKYHINVALFEYGEVTIPELSQNKLSLHHSSWSQDHTSWRFSSALKLLDDFNNMV